MRILAVLLVTTFGATLLSTTVIAQPGDDDEQRLKDIQQQLARAWKQHDRAFIESVLAPEWSVTQPDGTLLKRAVVLGPFFDAVMFDSNVIDDVSVMSFGNTAVVRGRTVASGTFNGRSGQCPSSFHGRLHQTARSMAGGRVSRQPTPAG